MPMKVPVSKRSGLVQHEQARADKAVLMVDPLLPLAQIQMMFDPPPCYSSLMSWVKTGRLRAWRPGGRGHFKVRLSWLKEFLHEHESGGRDAS